MISLSMNLVVFEHYVDSLMNAFLMKTFLAKMIHGKLKTMVDKFNDFLLD